MSRSRPLIDISGLEKAKILSQLFNKAVLTGCNEASLLMLEDRPKQLSVDDARKLITKHPSLDFTTLGKISIPINLYSDELDSTLYNKQHGEGVVEGVITEMRNDLKRDALTTFTQKAFAPSLPKSYASLSQFWHKYPQRPASGPFVNHSVVYLQLPQEEKEIAEQLTSSLKKSGFDTQCLFGSKGTPTVTVDLTTSEPKSLARP